MTEITHSNTANAPPLSTVHNVLKNRRRRYVVDVLAGRQAPIDLRVLARAIALRLPSEDDAVTTGDRVESIQTTLHHVDLPQLEAAEVLDYDEEETVVVPGDVERFEPFLDASAFHQ